MKLVKGDREGWEALFSDDELLRFTLQRPVYELEVLGMHLTKIIELRKMRYDDPAEQPMRRLVSCGLNPSKADAFRNDNTVRKEQVFAWLWQCRWYTKVNAYAWRDTFPKDMWAAHRNGADIVGSDRVSGNDQAIRFALSAIKRDGGIALAAWGTHVERVRACKLFEIAGELGVQWMCLGTNLDGSPKHSLYPPYSTQLEPWRFR